MKIKEQMDGIYERLSLDEIPWNLERPPELLVELVASGQVLPGEAVDLGCGAGNYTVWLAANGFRVTGLDISPEAIALAQKLAEKKGVSCRFIACDLTCEAEGLDLAGRLHVLPDFHGNRSPLADPHAVGVISGLTLDSSFDSLCRLYWRTAVSIALGVRHILQTLNERGYGIDTLHVTGGHIKNPLLMELYADAAGCTVIEPAAEDAVPYPDYSDSSHNPLT